ncbi:hypothetical protein Taro_039196 [Colocasia esculenta]|uniref:Uncharacterized protein n=1 Tax=Colocasia esculenta TaxID=4460 RepID=A0A843W8N9_COLES|nr:hypothetical protein [Colocasia esculenta]
MLRLFLGKVKSRLDGPYTVIKACDNGVVTIHDPKTGQSFTINGQRAKEASGSRFGVSCVKLAGGVKLWCAADGVLKAVGVLARWSWLRCGRCPDLELAEVRPAGPGAMLGWVRARAAAGAVLAGVDGTESEVPAAAASTDTLACSDLAAHSGNNLSPVGSTLLSAAPTAPLAVAPTDVVTAAVCTDVCLHERIASSTSRSGQHRLSLKKKRRKHSLDCPKGAVTEKTSLGPHSDASKTDTPSPGP